MLLPPPLRDRDRASSSSSAGCVPRASIIGPLRMSPLLGGAWLCFSAWYTESAKHVHAGAARPANATGSTL
jgi:hypothetical protein